MTDLKSRARDKLLEDMIQSVRGSGPWKVLIVDTHTMRIISAACRMYDIMELGVSLVEKIDTPRDPLPQMDAIYFLTPTEESVNELIKDFQNPKHLKYNTGHLFFTSRLPDEQLVKIRSKAVVSRIKTLKELNLDFLAIERRVFHFDSPRSFWSLFSPDSKNQLSEQKLIAEKVVSVFATLKDNPKIRFFASSQISSSLASLVQERLDALGRSSPEFAASGSEGARSVLLIVDRSFDVITPLLHEFTYQAMVYDLLQIMNDHYKYHTTTNIGSSKEKEVILGETDPLWPDLRHKHIADTMNSILDGFNDFVKDNKAAQLISGVLKESKGAQAKVDNLKEMSTAIKAMPQYQEMLDKYSLHINMATSAMKEYEVRQIAKLAALEQDMSTGEDAEGKSVKNILSRMPPILQDEAIRMTDKLRLLMLYVISQEGLKDSDRKRLLELAKVSHKDNNIITNLKYLGVNLVRVTKGDKKQRPKQSKKTRNDAPSFELSRYVPSIKRLIEETITGSLSKIDFPTTTSTLGSPKGSSKSPKFATSLRKSIQPKWADKSKSHKKDLEEENTKKNGRIVIFIAGGATYSEMRTVYELASQYNREIILGTTAIVRPDDFVTQLGDLKKMEFLEEDLNATSATVV